MAESQGKIPEIRDLYYKEAQTYVEFRADSFSWKYIEKPGFDRYLDTLLPIDEYKREELKVLDIGCGGGLLIKHMINNGFRANNITGIDLSSSMIDQAKELNPDANFLVSPAEEFEFPRSSFDLMISCMVLHYLDNKQLDSLFERVNKSLKPQSYFLYIDADPNYSPATRNPDNFDTWLNMPTPWGGTAPWFCRSPNKLNNLANKNNLQIISSETLCIDEAGKSDEVSYKKYFSYPARYACVIKNT